MARILHTYFRSSAAYRVRIAMNLKCLDAEHVFVHLNRNGGEQFGEAFRAINPQALVPVLSEEGVQIGQSLAIMEYLEEVYPQVPLLPPSPADRAFVRQLSLGIACDIHPINNLRVLQYLTRELGASEDQKNAWYRHWVEGGLAAVEAMLANDARTGLFCDGDAPGLADCCLVPQVFNARRFDCDLSAMPTLVRIADRCAEIDAFRCASAELQPDAG